jgi:hypothetical protein
MLNNKQQQFIQRWERVRLHEGTFKFKLLAGLPFAALFAFPILLSVPAVYLFVPAWFTKVSKMQPGTIPTIVIAVLLITFLFGYFRMQYKWEQNEELYQRLKAKK